MQAFFSMGGYGAYVWSAYFLTALILGLNLYLSKRAFRKSWLKLEQRTRAGGHH